MPLTISERIHLLRDICERLSAEEWHLVDLTLRQFHFQTTDDWQGSKEAYVLGMVESADDSKLLALGEHVGVRFAQRPVRVDPPFWVDGRFRLFISHLSAHKDYAVQLKTSLVETAVSAFVAHEDIEPTTEWQGAIETALATMDTMVALLHPGFHASAWTEQEVGHALGRGVPVFTVRLGEDPCGFLGRAQAFSGFNKAPEEMASDLFRALLQHKQTSRRMAESLVEHFKDSPNYAGAKTRIGQLEQIAYWHPQFAAEIRSALKNNSQIADSWGVPDRVERLIARHP